MSYRTAVFLLRNSRLIRAILSALAIGSTVALAARGESAETAKAAIEGGKLLADLRSDQLLALVAIAAVAGFCWTQWKLSEAVATLNNTMSAIKENLQGRPCFHGSKWDDTNPHKASPRRPHT